MRRALLPLALLLAIMANASSYSASPVVESGSKQQFSRTEVSVLKGGAGRYPYATLTLLYLLQYPPSEQNGSLYLEGIPTSSLSLLLRDSANRDAISSLLGSLQWSPYSWNGFFVQVSWSTRTLSGDAKVFEFRTRLLSALTTIDHPPLELPATVLLKAGSVRFLDRGSSM